VVRQYANVEFVPRPLSPCCVLENLQSVLHSRIRRLSMETLLY